MDPRADVDHLPLSWADFGQFLHARTDADSTYLTEHDAVGGPRRWSVREWVDTVGAAAGWLAARGVEEGGAVVTLLGNTSEALAIAFGAWTIGARCVPLNPNDGIDRQCYITQDCGAALAVLAPPRGELAERLGQMGGVSVAGLSMVDLTAQPAQPARPVLKEGLDAPALQVYTSGTTGHPKGVVLTARNLLADCDALLSGTGWQSDTRVHTVLPIHHVNGMVISSLLPWYGGFSTVLCSGFRTETFWEDVAAEGSNVCSVVPSLLEFLLRRPGQAPEGFREFLCGAGPLLVETVLEFEERYGVPVRHLYGLSETTAVLTLTPRMSESERRHWHSAHGTPSIGLPLPHVNVDIHDHTGEPVRESVRGQIVARGAVVMREYAGQPQATAEVFQNGWFHTGDEGFWVRRGVERMFFISGRIKELIVRGGANIAPVEIDQVLRAHPAIDYALAVPFTNTIYGEEVAAYVVTNAPVTDAEIFEHCAQHLDHARRPKVIVRGDDVPYTSTGKAKRIELARRLEPELRAYRDHQFRRSPSGDDGASSAGA